MLKNLLGRFSTDIGIDLGTANTLVYVKDKGIVINEPSVVAINTRNDQIIAIGDEAKKMIGKTPSYIVATRPLVDGIISDFEVTEKMLKYFIDKVHQENFNLVPRPRIVIGIPLEITEVEKKAVEDAAYSAGAREVYLVEEPMAAAIGARLPIQEAAGNLIVDIGGGTTEIATISLGGVVTARSLKVAGDEFDRDIINYAREHFNLILGERTAEDIKIKIGSACILDNILETKMRGRDMLTGLPREIEINDEHIRQAISRTITIIIDNIKSIIEITPPELVADVYERGIILCGGGALLRGLDKLLKKETGIPVTVMDDPLTAVVRGAGLILEDLENLKNVIIPSPKA